ncbi:MAG: TolC family protein [Bacteroidota bacterium]
MKKALYILILLILPSMMFAQQLSVNLEQCRDSAKVNWPGFKKMAMQKENKELIIKTLNKNYLPKLTLGAGATYQSEVVVFPEIQIPGMDNFFPTIPNDNYRADLQLSQIIYDGGNTKSAKDLQLASNSLEETQIEIENYNLMEQINQLYLNVLVLEQNNIVLLTADKEIDENLKILQSAYNNGMILASELNKVKAEKITIEKQLMNNKTAKLNAIQSLAVLTGLEINYDTSFQVPGESTNKLNTLPQLKIFEAQEDLNKAGLEMEFRNKFPKIALFANGGYGRPGYNFMDTDLHSYGMVGVNLSWDVIDWGTYGKQKEKSEVKQKIIEANKEAFVMQNSLEVQKINNDLANIQNQIEMDKKVIKIKEEIKNSSWSKFQNGTITSNEYLKDFNDLKRAQQTLEINKIQLIQKELALKHLEGIKY